MDDKPVIKIEMAGSVTSFRYPHFSQGVQPTFDVPPPSTIYGHICSAVGDYVAPDSIEFGYHFTHEGRFMDYREHLHFGDPIQPFPFDRELLFNPRLTLYVTPVSLLDAFRTPRYAVVLGRSQDLMTYTSVRIVHLQRSNIGYFEHSLLPLEMAPRLDAEVLTYTMPRFVDARRRASWRMYTVLHSPILWPPMREPNNRYDYEDGSQESLIEEDMETLALWVDPESPAHRKQPDARRAIWFHRFTDP